MKRLATGLLFATGMIFSRFPKALAENWPAWRGPTGQGICREKGLLTHWSEKENVKWKVSLPAGGNSTPIVWSDRVFLTQAVDGGKYRMLLCLARNDGRVLWKRTVRHEEAEPTHEDNPYCSASPVTDGERVIVSHGSAGVFCYGLDGADQWHVDVGKLHHIWGNASSPILYGDFVILNCGPGARTFLLALDKRTGKDAWKVEIPDGLEDGGSEKWTGSWNTPILASENGREDLIVGFPHRLRSYDPKTGKEIWSCGGLGRLVYSSPVANDGVIVALSGFMGPPMAVRSGGEGDVTATHQLWRRDRAGQQIGSGVVDAGRLYIVNESGVGECIEAKTGKTLWQERVGGRTWSSLVLADGNIYSLHESGDCNVFRASDKFELVAKSSLGEMTRASLAVSDGELFIRTYKHLWCLAKARAAAAPPVDADGRPRIVKLGTIDCDLVETTPLVFKGKLYRFEWVRKEYGGNKLGQPYFRFVDHETGAVTQPFAIGYVFGSAFVDGDTVYATGTSSENGWTGRRIEVFASKDLETWQSWTALDLEGFGICNTSIAKAGDHYVLMFEIHKPPEQAGVPFTARFATSTDLRKWELTPPECVYAKDRYTAPHCLRWLDGWHYDFYLEAHDGYEMRVVRSKDLIHWEPSPLNPVLRASDDDRKIANPKLTAAQRERIAKAANINNSDIDFCELQGRLVINYSWGNQQGVEHLAEASYEGTEEQFLRGWYPSRE